MRQLQRTIESFAFLYYAIDQADLEGFVRINGSPREHKVQGAALADEPRQADGSQVDQGHTPAPIEHAKHGVARGHTQVTPQSQFQSASNGVALDGSDYRLAQQHPGRSHGAAAVLFFLDRWTPPLGNLAQVSAGREHSLGASENRNIQLFVAIECVKCFS